MYEMKEIIKILNKVERLQFIKIVGMMIVGALVEAVSISAVIPIIMLIFNSNKIEEYTYIKLFIGYFDEINIQALMLTGFILLFLAKTLYAVYLNNKIYRYIFGVEERIQVEQFEKYLYSPYIYILSIRESDAINNIVKVSSTFCISALYSLMVIISESIIIIFLITLLTIISLKSIIFLLFLVPVFYITYKITKNKLISSGFKRLNGEAQCFNDISILINGIKELKLSGKEIYLLDKFQKNANESSSSAAIQLFLQSIQRPWIEFMGLVAVTAIVWFMKSAEIDSVEIISLLGVLAMIGFRMLPSISRILSSIGGIKFSQAAIEKINEIKSIDKEKFYGSESIGEINKIEFKNVTYKYPSSREEIYQGINIIINKGEIIGVTGKSGSGKSTLIDLISTLIKPISGQIEVNGGLITNFSNKEWRSKIAYVSQTTFVMNGSLKENICFGEPYDEKRMSNVLKISLLDEFILQASRGIESKIGENGFQLSGGLKQRLGIARALYKNIELIILDESSSALDEKTERMLFQNLESIDNIITIIISHRKIPLEYCNRILEVGGGKLNEIR